jgi:hypothetical protein
MEQWHIKKQPAQTDGGHWTTRQGKRSLTLSQSEAAASIVADITVADRQQRTSRRGVSNNLRGTRDTVLGFGGKVRSLQSIRKDIFRSADTLRLSKGQESRVFHRENFLDQNVVIRSANAYARM